MKKLLILIVTLLMLLPMVGFAEETDFSQMNYDELVEMKTALEAELRNRPEASPFTLTSGVYVVGIDIKPGRYFVATAAIDKLYASLNIFSTKETYDLRWVVGGNGGAIINCKLYIGEEAEYVELAEGNYVDIPSSPIKFSLLEFEEDDYCEYIPPEGTAVPAGTYIVGEDIPAGTYRVYPASLNWGDIRVYDNASNNNQCIDSQDINLVEGPYKTVRVVEGNMVKTDVDTIMNKQPTLAFD